MAIKTYKPTSPARRYYQTADFSELAPKPGLKRKLVSKKRISARNFQGRVTVRFRGGGHKRLLRPIDYKRNKDGVPARVEALEYDPNRSARIALLVYKDGEKRYILAPVGLKAGDVVASGPDADIRPGNCLPLRNIPLGTMIHNIELKEGKGGQIIRSAGTSGQLMAKEGVHVQVRLPTGEVRMFRDSCRATIGQVSNPDHENLSLGKAGRKRWMGCMPHNRGVAMNPVDHPMGGGEGKTSGGRHPCSPWGMPSKGYKTRSHKKASNRLIVKKRK